MYLNLNSIISLKKLLLLTITTAFLFIEVKGQLREGYKADIEVQAIGTTNGVVPFWMRSNQFGSIPLSGLSGSAIGRFSKNYEELSPNDEIYGRRKLIDWGFGLEGRANGGKNSNIRLVEAYVKGKLSIFQLQIGRSKDVMGFNGDTSLTSGNFSLSGNALGIPKIEISIPDFLEIPIFDGLFAIKGSFSHGWSGNRDVKDTISAVIYPPVDRVDTYLHQKSFYGRLGKKDWKFKAYAGFNHQVLWGGEKEIYENYYTLSPISTFLYVAIGKAYGNGVHIPISKIGNQLGSIDIGAEYTFDQFKLTAYRQNFYDVGALSKLANIKDGLNGVSLTNLQESSSNLNWTNITFEFLYTKNQAGELDRIYTKSGDEDYYNNYFYTEGWSYHGIGLGNPFLSPKSSVKPGQASDPRDFFINNRVVAYHIGIKGFYNDWNFLSKLSFSQNFGTFGTSTIGHSLGTINFRPEYGIFKKVNEISFYFAAEKEFGNKLTFGFDSGIDNGGLLNDSFGIAIKLKKTF